MATLRKFFRRWKTDLVLCLLLTHRINLQSLQMATKENMRFTSYFIYFSSAIDKTIAKKGVGLKAGLTWTHAHYTQHNTSLYLTQHVDSIFLNQNFLTIRQHTFAKQENFEQTIHQSVLVGEVGAWGVRKTSFERQEGKLLSSWPKSARAVNFANMMYPYAHFCYLSSGMWHTLFVTGTHHRHLLAIM